MFTDKPVLPSVFLISVTGFCILPVLPNLGLIFDSSFS